MPPLVLIKFLLRKRHKWRQQTKIKVFSLISRRFDNEKKGLYIYSIEPFAQTLRKDEFRLTTSGINISMRRGWRYGTNVSQPTKVVDPGMPGWEKLNRIEEIKRARAGGYDRAFEPG